MLSRPVSAALSHDGRMTAATRLLFATFILFLLSIPALAQSTAGRILGTVTDQTGASVPGATVVVTDMQRGTSRTVTSDDSRALGPMHHVYTSLRGRSIARNSPSMITVVPSGTALAIR